MEGHASISNEVLCRYAADAARDVAGVQDTSGRRGVKVDVNDGRATVELHLTLDWGASIPDVGRAVQRRVREYLTQMADVETVRVDIVVDELA